MNNGGAGSGRKHEDLHGKRKFHGDDFAHAITKIAVAQICENVEINTFQESHLREGVRFNMFQESALETLTDVTVRYINAIGKTAHHFANLAGRTDGNVFDIVQALEDLGSGLGFAGASDIDHCLCSSGSVTDIIHYIGETENIPFAYYVPCFPVLKDRKQTPSFLEIGEEPPDEHIPAWLPAFPDPNTWSEAGVQRAHDVRAEKTELDRQKREKECLVSSIHQPSCGDRSGWPLSVGKEDVAKSTQAAESNPFLSAPLYTGERYVSPVVPPTKFSNEVASRKSVPENHVINNHVPVLETFGSADEGKKSGLSDTDEREKKEPVNTRPFVSFKIVSGKNPLGVAINLSSEKKRSSEDCFLVWRG